MAVYLIESKVDQQKLVDYVGEDTAKLFFSLKDRLKSPENDIYYWLKREPTELEDRLSELQSTKTRREKDEEASEGAELIYNKDGWKVYHITTYEASAKYGKNTKWCIAGSKYWSNGEHGEEYFNQYTSNGIEFYFYIKNGTEKYALAYNPDFDEYQVFNAEDDDISNDDLFFLPSIDGLPKFNYDDLLSEDGTFIYEGGKVPKSLRDKIKRVEISSSADRIGYEAFAQCEVLESVDIPSGITYINNRGFWGCSSLPSIIIPDNVDWVGEQAFAFCISLESVVLSNNAPHILSDTFYECRSLRSIDIPSNMILIGHRAFYGCTSLKSIYIPDNVTTIGDDAFYGCVNLKSIYIPNSVTYLGDTFYSCRVGPNSSPIVYTDNEYVIECLKSYGTLYKPANEFPG